MREFFKPTATKIAVFVIASIVIGALLAPPLFWGGQIVVENGWIADGWLQSIHESMERAKFSRYFNRALTFAAVLLMWPTIRWIRSDQPERGNTNFLLTEKNRRWWIHLLVGFFAATIPLFILCFIYLKTGLYKPHDPGKTVFRIASSAIGTAFAVAFLEEFIFRGILFSLLLRTAKAWVSLLFLTAFFAFVHFLKPPENLEMPEVIWTTGFWLIGQIFGQFANPIFIAAEFALLFAVGWVLGYSRLKTASLWLPIGLHAGWVFGIKMFSPLTRRNFKKGEMMPWLGENLRIGACSMLVVCLTGLLIWWWLKKREARDRDAFSNQNSNQ
ncbi:MAG: CPBP family intramembrane metalloprotease [Verrucomicrobiales bacterium]|nr:CPBP family intramembrane metalloprotease [Verrucomicrobiales bacterium]